MNLVRVRRRPRLRVGGLGLGFDFVRMYGAKKPSGHGSVIVGSSSARISSIEVGIATPPKSVKCVQAHSSA